MKPHYFIAKFSKKLVLKLLDKFNDWACKSEVVFGEKTFFKSTASIDNISKKRDNIIIGENTIIRGKLLVTNYGGKIEIGNNVYIGIGSNVWSGESIKIGNDVLISHNVNIIDTNSHEINYKERSINYKKMLLVGHPSTQGAIETDKIIIESHSWISFGVSILKGVTIGKGAIVASDSVVTKDVPPFTLVAGNPAKVVKELDK